MAGYQPEGGDGRMGGKVQRIRSVNGRYKIDRGEVKNSIGNGETEEFICSTHGQEPREGNTGVRGCRADGNKGEKKMGQL